MVQFFIRAVNETPSLAKGLGDWQGLPIIAIGPKGGKIVGYTKDQKPIYAGSKKAHALSGMVAPPGADVTDRKSVV